MTRLMVRSGLARPGRAMHWVIYALASLLVLHGLGWITWQALRLEGAQAAARVQEQRRDAERLALWRMDSLASALVARETQRPYFEYRAFVAPGRPYELLWDPPTPGEAVRPGRLLLGDPAPEPLTGVVLLHYVVGPEGAVSSPQAPGDELLASAGVPVVDSARIDEASARLVLLRRLLLDPVAEDVFVEAASEPPGAPEVLAETAEAEREFAFRQQVADIANRADPGADTYLNNEQVVARSAETATSEPSAASAGRGASGGYAYGLVRPSSDALGAQALADAGVEAGVVTGVVSPARVRIGTFEARWVGAETLVLEREAVIDERSYTQGVWLDWAQLRSVLRDAAGDVLAGADAAPAVGARDASSMLLAALPVRLVSPELSGRISLGMTPIRWSLVLTWLAVLTAVVAVGVVLRQAVTLSERRGRFVSAVTHELRTPLTTFQLYSQMLADGMVSDESVRAGYLSTLKSESARLAGIVENVLEYARLSRRQGPREASAIAPVELLARLRPVLVRRAEQGDMDLVVQDELDPGDSRVVRADVDAVGRILVNLVDNACKYAGGEGDDADPRIHLVASVERDGALGLLVADHGPGILAADRERVFGEFRRGERGSRTDRGGLGLGLALSRGLAREMGGELRVVMRRGHGAELLLTLPLAGG